MKYLGILIRDQTFKTQTLILNVRPKTIKGMAALLKFESEVCWIQTLILCIVSQMFNNCATGAQPE